MEKTYIGYARVSTIEQNEARQLESFASYAEKIRKVFIDKVSGKGNNRPQLKICKNLFLCNRQKTSFYMLLMPGEKPFKTKFLTSQLNCARLSFAEADKMQEYLHTIPGSVSALELIFDTDNNIQLVIDNDLMKEEYICGHPGINTSTVRLFRDNMLKYVRAAKHEPTFIDLPTE